MMRNSRNIWATEASAATGATGRASTGGVRAASLMALGLVPLEAINHAGLGYAEREPILYVPLQRDVELGGKLLLLFRYVFSAIELELKSELSHQRLVLAASAP